MFLNFDNSLTLKANMSNTFSSHTALLVIDVQQSFEHRPYWIEAQAQEFKNNLQQLISYFEQSNQAIVNIFHIDESPAFQLASGWVKSMDFLSHTPHAEFYKHVHNAFTDTGLDCWLRKNKIEHLVISGIRTEQCCETTARVASDLAYRVSFITDATLTFEMTHPNSLVTYSSQEIKDRTELVLHDRFATIATTKEFIHAN
jgi:nicotinamidase-related amidase